MAEGFRPAHELRDRRTVETERYLFETSLAPTFYSHVKLAVGAPSDADYSAQGLAPPPLGWHVIDSTGLKVWFRVAVGTWRGVAIA